MRGAAAQAMGRLPPAVQAAHVGGVVAQFEHDVACTRRMALCTLEQLSPLVQAANAGAVAALCRDVDKNVRRTALEVLLQMPSEVDAVNAGAVLAFFSEEGCYYDDDPAVVKKLQLWTKPHPDLLALHIALLQGALKVHTSLLQGTLENDNDFSLFMQLMGYTSGFLNTSLTTSSATARLLSQIVPATEPALSTHVAAVVAQLSNACDGTRLRAVRALHAMGPLVLAPHAAAMASLFQDALQPNGLRTAAVRAQAVQNNKTSNTTYALA